MYNGSRNNKTKHIAIEQYYIRVKEKYVGRRWLVLVWSQFYLASNTKNIEHQNYNSDFNKYNENDKDSSSYDE